MIKEPKNVDFLTTGRQPSEADFARISDWIAQDKARQQSRERARKNTARTAQKMAKLAK